MQPVQLTGDSLTLEEVVDVARESFVTAGLAPAQPARPSHHAPAPAADAMASIGTDDRATTKFAADVQNPQSPSKMRTFADLVTTTVCLVNL
jgi:hypothetical protein